MANWGNAIITARGKALEDKARQRGVPLTFTKYKFGDGVLSSGRSYEAMTDLISPKLTIGITRKEINSGGGTLIGGILTNKDLNTGFNMCEAGLYANDPDLGEILYLVMTDRSPDYLPPKTSDTVVSVDFSALVVVDSALNVSVTLDSNSLLILRDLLNHDKNTGAHENAFAAHNTSNVAHKNLFSSDTTSYDESKFGSSSSILNLGARIKWVKNYVDKKLRDFSEFKAAQISDFKTKITEHLLASASASLVSTLNSDSLISVMIQKALQVSGARYSLEDNGFIVFGKYFGNFCIQWGGFDLNPIYADVTLLISLSRRPYAVFVNDINWGSQTTTENKAITNMAYAIDNATPTSIRITVNDKNLVGSAVYIVFAMAA